jgi:hypothetical protein
MRNFGLTIDPGMSNGVCLFSWTDEQDGYFRQEEVWQFGGGAEGLADFMGYYKMRSGPHPTMDGKTLDALIVEKFTPRGGPEFRLTQDSVEPLRGEGVLIGRGFVPYITWQPPAAQYFMGGATLPERKKRSREFLKRNGIYITGGLVGQRDADDAISAELHAIAWLRRRRHMPTLVEFFTEEEE